MTDGVKTMAIDYNCVYCVDIIIYNLEIIYYISYKVSRIAEKWLWKYRCYKLLLQNVSKFFSAQSELHLGLQDSLCLPNRHHTSPLQHIQHVSEIAVLLNSKFFCRADIDVSIVEFLDVDLSLSATTLQPQNCSQHKLLMEGQRFSQGLDWNVGGVRFGDDCSHVTQGYTDHIWRGRIVLFCFLAALLVFHSLHSNSTRHKKEEKKKLWKLYIDKNKQVVCPVYNYANSQTLEIRLLHSGREHVKSLSPLPLPAPQ